MYSFDAQTSSAADSRFDMQSGSVLIALLLVLGLLLLLFRMISLCFSFTYGTLRAFPGPLAHGAGK